MPRTTWRRARGPVFLLLASSLAACGSPEGAGQACQGQGCDELTLAFTRPTEPAHAGASLDVELSVEGAEPDAVYLVVDGARGPALSPPFAAALDTSGLAEGEHTLDAFATLGGRTFQARSRIALAVDHTPPVVVSLTPAGRATNVWSRDPVVITFSEAIDPASLTLESVVLADDHAMPLAHVDSLSASGSTLTVRTVGLPDVPNVLHASLGPVRDLAGNALRRAPVQWQWSLPAWQDLDSPVWTFSRYGNTARLGVDAHASPTVMEWPQASGGLRAWRWSGTAWNAFTVPTLTPGFFLALDEDSQGRMAMALDQRSAGPGLWLTAWTGATWSDPTLVTAEPSHEPVVRMGAGGTAIAAWQAAGDVLVGRWDGTSWQPLGSPPITSSPMFRTLDLSFDADGTPRLTGAKENSSVTTATYSEATGSWTTTSTGLFPYAAPDMVRATSTGDLYALVLDTSASPHQARVYRYYPGAVTGVPHGWELLAGPLNVTADQDALDPVIQLDAAGNPVAAWSEGNSAWAARWNGAAWEMLGGDLDDRLELDAWGQTQLAITPDGVITVLWDSVRRDPQGSESNFMVKRYNR